jgi:hypothetical protein
MTGKITETVSIRTVWSRPEYVFKRKPIQHDFNEEVYKMGMRRKNTATVKCSILFYLMCGLFNDAASSSGYAA